jgi:two-component system phosphate regulon sensor histidine kinase PhoR
MISVGIIFFGMEFFIEKFFFPNDEIADVFSSLIGALLFTQCRIFFDRITERIFLRAKTDLHTEFLTNISHELQTPIAILRGNIEFLQRREVSEMERASAERVILNTLDGMSRLIGNVLESAKLKFSKKIFCEEDVAIKKLLKETYEDVILLAKDKEIAFSVSADDPAGEEIFVKADRDRLKEVLLNFISNALRHTERRGSVVLWAGRVGAARVRIVVEDLGCGIPVEELPHIFERFYRIRSDPGGRVPSGTGIGLNICRQIVEAHGGTIIVESQMGKGSRFIVQLPVL